MYNNGRDFFEDLTCVANLIMIRSVFNMFSVGELSLNIYMICLYQKLDFDRCISTRVNHEQESRKLDVYLLYCCSV